MVNPKGFMAVFELRISADAVTSFKTLVVEEDIEAVQLNEGGDLFVAGCWRVASEKAGRITIRYNRGGEGQKNYVKTIPSRPGRLLLGFENEKPRMKFYEDEDLTRAEKSGVNDIHIFANMNNTLNGLCNVDDNSYDFAIGDGTIVLSRDDERVTYQIAAATWYVVCSVCDGRRYADLYLYNDNISAALTSLETWLDQNDIVSIWDYRDQLEEDYREALEQDVSWP